MKRKFYIVMFTLAGCSFLLGIAICIFGDFMSHYFNDYHADMIRMDYDELATVFVVATILPIRILR